jgi:hypothetical protein
MTTHVSLLLLPVFSGNDLFFYVWLKKKKRYLSLPQDLQNKQNYLFRFHLLLVWEALFRELVFFFFFFFLLLKDNRE